MRQNYDEQKPPKVRFSFHTCNIQSLSHQFRTMCVRQYISRSSPRLTLSVSAFLLSQRNDMILFRGINDRQLPESNLDLDQIKPDLDQSTRIHVHLRRRHDELHVRIIVLSSRYSITLIGHVTSLSALRLSATRSFTQHSTSGPGDRNSVFLNVSR